MPERRRQRGSGAASSARSAAGQTLRDRLPVDGDLLVGPDVAPALHASPPHQYTMKMKEHALVVCDIVSIRYVVSAVLRVSGQDDCANTGGGDVREQNVDRRDRAPLAPTRLRFLHLSSQ